MISHTIRVDVPITSTPRVLQIQGLFDVPPAERAERVWDVQLPIDERPWQIGLIVGPSGSGKTTIARALWPDRGERENPWLPGVAIVDCFPKTLAVKVIVDLLNHVGLSSPPSWLKPYEVLSTGERFRADLAWQLAVHSFIVYDEFTSVVDRTVAQIGSAAVAKAIRRHGKQFVAVTCHEDIEPWLQPDWVYQPATGEFAWRSLQCRPPVEVDIVRCSYKAWPLFRYHHYLSNTLNTAAVCFLATWQDNPVAFSSWLAFPLRKNQRYWREHRTVCLPDYQGVGIGTTFSSWGASLFAAQGARVVSTTSHPAMIASRSRSRLWQTTREMGGQFVTRKDGTLRVDMGGKSFREKGMRTRAAAAPRFTASFRYVGPPLDPDIARAMLERQ